MKGFSLQPLLPSIKARVTAIHQHDNRLYVGLATGTLQVYSYDPQSDGGVPSVKLLSSTVLVKKPVEQIGVLALTKQILILSDSVVTVYPIDSLSTSKAKVIGQARNAHTFAVVQYDPSTSKGKRSQDGASAKLSTSAEGLAEMIVIGCRKKVVVFSGIKPGFKEAWELTLPHSPRHIIVPTSSSSRSLPFPETVHLLYSPTSSSLLHISPSAPFLTVSDIPPVPPPSPLASSAVFEEASSSRAGNEGGGSGSGLTGMGVGALTGLGGYVGLGSKAVVPVGCAIGGGEVLLGRDDIGAFLSSEGTYTRPQSLQWPTAPEAIAFSSPYIYSITPPVATGSSSSSSTSSLPSLTVHLGPSLSPRATLTVQSPSAGTLTYANLTMTTQSSSRTPADTVGPAAKLLFSSTPTDKALLAAEGSSVWALSTSSLEDHVDDLVREGRVGDAIGLVESVGEAGFSPTRRLPHLKTLQAVTAFASGNYQPAIETFLIFNINPGLILSLYPAATISGRLHVPRDRWMEVFGAVPDARLVPEVTRSGPADEGGAKGLLKSVTNAAGLTKRSSMDSLRTTGTGGKEGKAETGSMNEKGPVMNDEEMPRAALEALMYYLSDRRQKLTGAMNALSTPLPSESTLPPISALPPEDLHNLSNLPLTELEPEQLLRVAQVIYTGLLKVYLVARPILVGSLCRIENWCDVEEVEELLKAQKKFSDLIDLYQGKKMHGKALKMLHELAMDEEDRLDRYPPTVRYLQKLGPGELALILETSKWVFEEDPMMALQIFTADEPEVDALPRREVMLFLEKTHKQSCIAYLHHIIDDLTETGADFHDKLAELLLVEATNAPAEGASNVMYQRLLAFLSSSEHYRSNRLLARIPSDDMPEARAILLGRMGKNEEALRIFIYRLKDYDQAEKYCSKVYMTDPDPKGIFLLLLRLYLRPAPSDPILLQPALGLIASQGTRLDAEQVLELLPPLVTMEDVRAFFVKTLRDGRKKRNEAQIVKGLLGARKEEVERVLMDLQGKKVRVTDQRICPQCYKRLGQSAIAVHAPRGEVTHLHCKDPFSIQLARIRG